jgi:outer membrane protein OmpA-like peptidoglycan-associated protein
MEVEKKPLKSKKTSMETKENQEPIIQIKSHSEITAQDITVQRISKKHMDSGKILFQKTFYPFFKEQGHVPYQIRLNLEKIIPSLRGLLKKYPAAKIVVQGYTSPSGKDEFNRLLSLWRAQQVAQYLSWKSRIPLKKFRLYGKGELKKDDRLSRRVKVLVVR